MNTGHRIQYDFRDVRQKRKSLEKKKVFRVQVRYKDLG